MNPSSTKLTHKRVLGVAIPIVLANATIPILGAVDTGVVGQMGLAVPIGAASPIWPTTPVSTAPRIGMVAFAKTMGMATPNTLL